MTPRVVFDCMVFLQAITSEHGPAFACLRLVEEDRLVLVVSHEVLSEVREVLARPKVRGKFPHLDDDRVTAFLEWVEQKAVMLADVPRAFDYARDPDDEPYVNLAVAGQARYLVSRDKDLLDLMSDDDFLQRYPHLTVINPVAILRELASEPEVEPTSE